MKFAVNLLKKFINPFKKAELNSAFFKGVVQFLNRNINYRHVTHCKMTTQDVNKKPGSLLASINYQFQAEDMQIQYTPHRDLTV